VRLEDAGRGELTQLVADHVLGDVDGDERLAVVHAERVADEVGRDGRAAGPGLDRLLGAGLGRLLDLLEQVVIDEETFFDGTSHGSGVRLLLVAWRTSVVTNQNLATRSLRATTRGEAFGKLAPRRHEMLATATTF